MVTALATCLALLCWPTGSARTATAAARPHGATEGAGTGRRLARLSGAPIARWIAGAIAVAVTVVWIAGGPAVAAATALLSVTAAALTRSDLRRRRQQSDLAGMLAAVRTLAREVRSGAQPSAALTAVAAVHRGASGRVLEQLAAVIRNDRGRATVEPPGGGDQQSEVAGRLAEGWVLSARYGVPWVGLIDALATDLAERVRAASARAGQVSGPRVSGYVLALMPGLGLVLGVGMGADPVGILLGTGAGHLMLLTGTALTCAGLCWTAKIVAG